MCQFTIKSDAKHDLTRIVFSGTVTGEHILGAMKRFYESTITAKVLWDFKNSDVGQLSSDDLFTIIDAAKKYAHLRVHGKSVLLVNEGLPFGLARMHKTLSELDRYQIPMEIFTSEDEAVAWLDS